MIKNIKYFDNDIQHGINYDWTLIKKEFDKLGIPDNVVNPFLTHKLECGKWVVDMSERSIGKTTNWLLLGMVMNKLYGTTPCYIRQRRSRIWKNRCRYIRYPYQRSIFRPHMVLPLFY